MALNLAHPEICSDLDETNAAENAVYAHDLRLQ